MALGPKPHGISTRCKNIVKGYFPGKIVPLWPPISLKVLSGMVLLAMGIVK